ncbi:hypothetical protein ACLJJ6_05280 [Pediococcus siamensis]|uniref:hypothetical protein n=1 Tax=Pediococcus siamensis TaxID=381829 RepID=UPI00399F2BCC
MQHMDLIKIKSRIDKLGTVDADSTVELATFLKVSFIKGITPETTAAEAASIEIRRTEILTSQLFRFCFTFIYFTLSNF